MFSNLADWDNIFSTFEKRYQHIVAKMVDWYPSGRNEFTIVMDDSDELVYNFAEDRIRRSYTPKHNSNDYTASEWSQEYSIRLKRKMLEQQISQEELSELTGISRVMLSKYMNNRAIPSVYNARLIAKALDCSMHELYEF